MIILQHASLRSVDGNIAEINHLYKHICVLTLPRLHLFSQPVRSHQLPVCFWECSETRSSWCSRAEAQIRATSSSSSWQHSHMEQANAVVAFTPAVLGVRGSCTAGVMDECRDVSWENYGVVLWQLPWGWEKQRRLFQCQLVWPLVASLNKFSCIIERKKKCFHSFSLSVYPALFASHR